MSLWASWEREIGIQDCSCSCSGQASTTVAARLSDLVVVMVVVVVVGGGATVAGAVAVTCGGCMSKCVAKV